MRTETVEIYTFSELSNKAQFTAIEGYRDAHAEWEGSFWDDESLKSIEAFCVHFGVRLKNWQLEPIQFSHNADNATFRGLRLRDIDRELMPTGYCLDNTLFYAFYDEFKKTGSAKKAFEYALYEGFREWRDDKEYQCSDEVIKETIESMDIEFYENGGLA